MHLWSPIVFLSFRQWRCCSHVIVPTNVFSIAPCSSKWLWGWLSPQSHSLIRASNCTISWYLGSFGFLPISWRFTLCCYHLSYMIDLQNGSLKKWWLQIWWQGYISVFLTTAYSCIFTPVWSVTGWNYEMSFLLGKRRPVCMWSLHNWHKNV